MAQDVIGVLFGVQGGGDINGESGKRIVKDYKLRQVKHTEDKVGI